MAVAVAGKAVDELRDRVRRAKDRDDFRGVAGRGRKRRRDVGQDRIGSAQRRHAREARRRKKDECADR